MISHKPQTLQATDDALDDPPEHHTKTLLLKKITYTQVIDHGEI